MKSRFFPLASLFFEFGSQRLEDYSAEKPNLDLRTFLNGPMVGAGVFVGLSGRVEQHFSLDMRASWSGEIGVLEEDCYYSDGTRGQRNWNFRFVDNATFTATSEDVEGEAQGGQCGNAAVMRYRYRIKRSGKPDIVVSMDDWFYLMQNNVMINRVRMSKFGLKVGELTAAYYHKPTAEFVDPSSP